MICPECQTENPGTRNFCRECGAKLTLLCPRCSSENLPGDKFCGECGSDLTAAPKASPRELSFDEKIDKLQRYLPEGLTEKILSQRDKIEGEKKQVTVMFCDLEEYTPLVERVGAEEAYSIMDQVYEILIHKVHDYEGTVNEMTGDGIMALFGAPIALEDAPQRAIRSAHSIHREMTKFNQILKEDGKDIPPLKMRIGIHTGPVVVGTLGNNLRVEFKAVGDTVNLASRVETLTEPGATNVTEDTFRLTEGLFRFEALEDKQVKGFDQPVRIYRVIAPSSHKTRFDVSAERGLTPFLGRQRELELLLDGLERVKAGHGQAFSVVSEAGLGKSRLLYEFRKAVGSEDLTFLEGKCLSYGKGMPYHPIADILRSNFDIGDEDDDAAIRTKVKSGLANLGAEEPTILPYMLELLSVRDSGIDKIMMSPEGKKDQIIETLKEIVTRGAQVRPLILAVEDLHWADKSSEDILKALISIVPGARVFLLFTYRPEFVPGWSPKSYQSQITLNRLSNRESIRMAEYHLGSKRMSPSLQEMILERTEGVPFFIEEFVQSLGKLKIIEEDGSTYRLKEDARSIEIPATIQDVIMARVDALPEAAKDLLQIGSVIEREFSYELIKRIAELQEQELLSHLSVLKDSELVFETGVPPRLNYVFKHALTRDVIYDSILRSRKRELHNKIANTMEEINQENLDEYYGVLANHSMKGENYTKAAEFSKFAAKRAQRTGALDDAIAHGEKWTTYLEKLPRTDNVEKKIIDARATLGLYYTQTNNFLLSKATVDPVVSLASRHDYKRRIGQIESILGIYAYTVEEDIPRALKLLQSAIKTAAATGDPISLVMGNHWMGHVLADNCEFEQSLSYLNKGLDISTMANVLWGIAAQKSCIARTVYLYQGRVDLGYPMSCEGLQLAEESGDSYSKAEGHISVGMACLQKLRLEDAKEHVSTGGDLCERLKFHALHSLAEWCLGETYFVMEEYRESKNHHENALRILKSNSIHRSFALENELAMVRSMVMNKENITNLDEYLTYADKNKAKFNDGRIRRCLAQILLYSNTPDVVQAERWIHEALKADRKNGLLFDLAMDFLVCGEVYKRKDNRSKAKEAVGEAIRVFQECGADGWVAKYQKELAAL